MKAEFFRVCHPKVLWDIHFPALEGRGGDEFESPHRGHADFYAVGHGYIPRYLPHHSNGKGGKKCSLCVCSPGRDNGEARKIYDSKRGFERLKALFLTVEFHSIERFNARVYFLFVPEKGKRGTLKVQKLLWA
ncbi:hypothetical protein TNIN_499031 [Trichonephila inaurata madagascariensis]|uniref:Uncharacterized protein n=1 Tax=Trichonephila inaurata madagascariensis TaxID=2747483 RepID=A0A8X6WPX4_9ARAC|nr:hypothetical protein TNIN_499031 [Trichonephila inaurata madagascariensis]